MASSACKNGVTRQPTILIVEDESLVRVATAQAFELAGWRVLQAATGDAALHLIHHHRPSVVFTDISLGDRISGWEVGSLGCAYGAKLLYASGDRSAQARMLPDGTFFLKPYATRAVIDSCAEAIGFIAQETSD